MIISNTQIATKNLCDKAHDLRFIKNLEPKRLPPAIYRGVLGHSALEQYYLLLRDGKPVEECRDGALAVLDREIARISRETPEEFEQISLILGLRKLIEAYAEVYRIEPFKVLEVEKEYHAPVSPSIDYGLRLDLLVEMTSGEYRGDLVVVDHKIVYNFKTALDIQMDAQLPKYIKALRENGLVVTKGIFNQIRYRSLKNPSPVDLYRRDWLKSNKAEIEQIWSEQERVANQIVLDTESKAMPIRTLSLLVCRSCMFQGPCKAELNGDDVTQMLEANYQSSTYGYADLSDAS
jgi:hypothetical protein